VKGKASASPRALLCFPADAVFLKLNTRIRKMTTITITLPDSVSEYLDSEMKSRGIEDPSEYFQNLLIEDQKRAEMERLCELIQEGLDSASSEMTQEDWREIREEVHRRHADRMNKT